MIKLKRVVVGFAILILAQGLEARQNSFLLVLNLGKDLTKAVLNEGSDLSDYPLLS